MGRDVNWIDLIYVTLQLITAIIVLRSRNDIRKIEVATNSMKDALVRSTDVAARAEGKAEGKLEERAEVADRKAVRDNQA